MKKYVESEEWTDWIFGIGHAFDGKELGHECDHAAAQQGEHQCRIAFL
jgi:hypothetical protein